ncbi:hypothetical protein EZV62_018437 [Acer yangbiense]|uniref:Uncharacterized protein n=1 Tax=Acer yangbiense TaxID=1000413 RepID=A0A5C7HJT2_9ROSI|nr:hypothetical protein EZV62_018437 [Acer yangbiense]
MLNLALPDAISPVRFSVLLQLEMKEAKFNSLGLGFFTFYWLILVVLLNGNRYLEHLSGLVRGNGEILSQVVSSQAWLKSSLVWNSETNGNQANMATSAKITNPIKDSYPFARALEDPHNPRPLINDLIGDTSGLGPFKLEDLQDCEYKFMSKYVKVGSIKNEEVPVEIVNLQQRKMKESATIQSEETPYGVVVIICNHK